MCEIRKVLQVTVIRSSSTMPRSSKERGFSGSYMVLMISNKKIKRVDYHKPQLSDIRDLFLLIFGLYLDYEPCFNKYYFSMNKLSQR